VYWAFLFALVIGCIISYFVENLKKTSPLFNKSVLDNYVYIDIGYLVHRYFAGLFLVSPVDVLITVKYGENLNPAGRRSLSAAYELTRQKKNTILAKKLEIVAGAMQRDGSDPKHGALSDAFLEYCSGHDRQMRALYIKAYLVGREKDIENEMFNLSDKINSPKLFDPYGELSSDKEVNHVRGF